MDAFYASVEQRDNPELRGKPVVSRRSAGPRCRQSGQLQSQRVRGALDHAVGHGQAKCPDLIFVPPRFDTYKAISLRIRDIVAEYTLIIEHLSLDEAYLERSAQSDDRDP